MNELEQINELLEDIKKKGLLVIVEGIKDEAALNSLGIKNVITLKKPLYAVVEEVASEKEVVLLTDLDEKGRQLYHTLSRDLQKHGVSVNNKLREFLFRTKLRHIEGLDTYLSNSSS